ncbi:hypothetical protein FUAX_54270 (plasmid) [Fulvitalea axinellae]|uniref:Outer membrane protein beta-barrel domain-containing protein n=1 Tax=Fulvitalea axinellae TaxID=1182444 RepID=A0AAU9CVB6_9BACT|nr:hypothetical protein FUAX_54270 [Fulvitalea axinellae]
MKRYVLFVLLIMGYGIVQAQDIRYHILDGESGKGVDKAQVGFFDQEGRTLSVALSDSAGYVSVTAETRRKTSYVLAHCMGYTQAKIKFETLKRTGTISLTADPVELEAVTVATNKETLTVKPDRLVFTVTPGVLKLSPTSMDLLKEIPNVTVRSDNSIRIKHYQGVAVYINGVISPEGARALQSLAPEQIERIEVITMPTLEYRGPSLLVYTKRMKLHGIESYTRLEGAVPWLGQLNGSLKAKIGGKTNFTGSYFFQSYNYSDERTNDVYKGETLESAQGYTNNTKSPYSYDIYLGVESYPTDDSYWSMSYRIEGKNDKYTREGEGGREISTDRQVFIPVSFHGEYWKKFTENDMLRVKGNYRNTPLINTAYQYAGYAPNERNGETDYNWKYYGANVTYTRTAGRYQWKAMFGGENDENRSEYDFGGVTGVKQQVRTLEAELGLEGKWDSWSFSAYATGRQIFLDSEPVSDGEEFHRNYTIFGPNVSVSHKLNDTQNIRLQISRGVGAPETEQINPQLLRTGFNSITQGNPNLDLVVNDKAELEYNRMGDRSSFSATAYTSVDRDFITGVMRWAPEEESNINTYINNGTRTKAGISLDYKYRKDWFSFGLSPNMFWQKLRNSEAKLTVPDPLNLYAFGFCKARLPKGFQLGGSVFYMPGEYDLQMEQEHFYSIDFELNKSFGPLNCKLYTQNLISKGTLKTYYMEEGYKQDSYASNLSFLKLSVSYYFEKD